MDETQKGESFSVGKPLISTDDKLEFSGIAGGTYIGPRQQGFGVADNIRISGTNKENNMTGLTGVRIENGSLVTDSADKMEDQGYFEVNIDLEGIVRGNIDIKAVVFLPDTNNTVLVGEVTYDEDELDDNPIRKHKANTSGWQTSDGSSVALYEKPDPKVLSQYRFAFTSHPEMLIGQK